MADIASPKIDQSQGNKFLAKIKENPLVPLGTLGMFGMAAYGIRNFKNRGDMSASMYIMQYRVKAQSVVVGAMALGVGYTLLRDYVFHKDEHKKKLDEHYK